MENRIEFIGIPGAGKTTLYKSILKNLNKRQIITYNDMRYHLIKKINNNSQLPLISKVKHQVLEWANILKVKLSNEILDYEYNIVIDLLFINPEYLQFLKDSINQSFLDNDRKPIVLSRYLKELSTYQKYSILCNESKLKIIDEGLVHRSIIFLSHYKPVDNITEQFETFFNPLYLPKKVIYVKAPVELCFNRMQKRKKGIPRGLKYLSSYKVKQVLKQEENYIEKSLIPFLISNNVEIIEVNNLDVKESTKKVLNKIY